jgi:hypothetical protein
MKKFSELGITLSENHFIGDKIEIDKILNTEFIIHAFKIEKSKFPKNKSGNRLTLQIEFDNEKRIIFSGSDVLMDLITQVDNDSMPFSCKIVRINRHFEFR